MMDPQKQLAAQLKDIKPPVEISDWSIYLYWSLVGVGILVAVAVLYFAIKYLLGKKKINKQKEYLEALKRINWNDPKHSAYEATKLGRLLKGDDKRLNELYKQMVSELEKYKYKKEVDPIESGARSQYELFVKACDESF